MWPSSYGGGCTGWLFATIVWMVLIVGLLVSIFQAVTSIQEQSLAFIPKILVTGAVIALAGPWMIDQMVGYTHDLYSSIPTMVGP